MAEILTDGELKEIQAASRDRDFSFAGGAIDTLIASHRALAAERDRWEARAKQLAREVEDPEKRVRALESACEAALKYLEKIDTGALVEVAETKQVVEQLEGAIKHG